MCRRRCSRPPHLPNALSRWTPKSRAGGPGPRGTRLALSGDVMNFLTTTDVDKSWDRFVESHPRATVAHLSAWGQIAREVYGHEPVYLRAEEDGEIRGVLPLVLVSGRLFGRRLVSMPFLDYGGVLAGGEQGLETALIEQALAQTPTC